jgi:molybdenum cofactor synthesis domain-containing protein
VIKTTANAPTPNEVVTAALMVIGDKILSGRTKDKNIGYIAEYLTALGIDLMEVRVVGDEEMAIVDALNALRHHYTYVFTTGGIGPTHDDITANSVAKAFGDLHSEKVLPVIQEIQESGVKSLRGIARALAARGIPTARGGEWTAVQVSAILHRRDDWFERSQIVSRLRR